MTKKALIAVLAFSTLIELLFSLAGFIAPEWTMQQFKVAATPETYFLGYIVAWCLLAVALSCGHALRRVMAGDPAGHRLATLLGLWWVGIGIGIFVKFGRPENLVLDSLKGALLVGLSLASKPRA